MVFCFIVSDACVGLFCFWMVRWRILTFEEGRMKGGCEDLFDVVKMAEGSEFGVGAGGGCGSVILK